ncbi:hypothetical protein GCM10008012_37870 [Rhizobium anhuiense]|nr:hypothetical protein GCM10008012_37870 [Rhizobium anhuiense]
MIAQMDLTLLPMDERIDMIKIEHGACLPGNLDWRGEGLYVQQRAGRPQRSDVTAGREDLVRQKRAPSRPAGRC